MLSAAAMADSLIAARKLTSGALGVNVFVLQPAPATTEQVDAYAAALSEEAERYGVRLGEPHRGDVDDDWAAKLDALATCVRRSCLSHSAHPTKRRVVA